MKTVVLFLLFVATVEVCCYKKSLEEEWQDFVQTYNKTYRNSRETKKRFAIFRKNLKEINDHNKKYKYGLMTFEKGLNRFADMTKKEFKKKYNLWIPKDLPVAVYVDNAKNENSLLDNQGSENFDWRQMGAVTDAKDQGECGACWIFSAVGALESYHFKKTGHLMSLSEQNVIDCFSNSTCQGGFPEDALRWVKDHGLTAEQDYPYRAAHRKCHPPKSKRLNVTFDQIVKVNNTEEDLRIALEEHGPIVVSLFVTNRWRFYRSGVWYDRNCSDLTNHSMLVVGYGREKELDFWLIKNSWGPDWGLDGYIKIARNRHQNYCGLTAESFYII